jgi:hypothetical protein
LEGIYQIQLFFTFFDKKNLYFEVIGIWNWVWSCEFYKGLLIYWLN